MIFFGRLEEVLLERQQQQQQEEEVLVRARDCTFEVPG
jgi:hypothetical protein